MPSFTIILISNSLLTHIMASENLHKLIQKIADKLANADKHLISALQAEIDQLSQNKKTTQAANKHRPEVDMTSGCYRFDGDPGYYCPHCFDRLQQRIPTQRINRQLRVCSQCRSNLKPSQ